MCMYMYIHICVCTCLAVHDIKSLLYLCSSIHILGPIWREPKRYPEGSTREGVEILNGRALWECPKIKGRNVDPRIVAI